MAWLLVPIIIWAAALVVMGLPKMIEKKVQKLKDKLKVEAELAKHENPEESIYKGIEEGLLEMVSTQKLCFVSSIVGLLLMALGTLALCAVLLL